MENIINIENIKYLKYKKENDIYILQLNIDEYKEIQNALQLLYNKRITAKKYYYKLKNKEPIIKVSNKYSLLLPNLKLINTL